MKCSNPDRKRGINAMSRAYSMTDTILRVDQGGEESFRSDREDLTNVIF
jgi:hypothetical protein